MWAILGQANSTVGALLETSAALADEPALQGTALSTLPDSLAVISADLAAVAGNVRCVFGGAWPRLRGWGTASAGWPWLEGALQALSTHH